MVAVTAGLVLTPAVVVLAVLAAIQALEVQVQVAQLEQMVPVAVAVAALVTTIKTYLAKVVGVQVCMGKAHLEPVVLLAHVEPVWDITAVAAVHHLRVQVLTAHHNMGAINAAALAAIPEVAVVVVTDCAETLLAAGAMVVPEACVLFGRVPAPGASRGRSHQQTLEICK
jgi:hypothetical protein